MKRFTKVLGVVAALLGITFGAGAIVIGHDAACAPAPALREGAPRMQAIVYRCFGPPEVLKLEEIEKPVAADGQVLVKVHAAAANPLDWHYMRGKPYLMRLAGAGIGVPADPQFGVDFAGTVEAVGPNVSRFRPGDAVFGGRSGAFAEYLVVREDRAIAHKPDNIDFEQAAAVPIAAVTALQALRDKGQLQPGQKVLVNGASGGVGTFAVQIAKAMGAEVTGVCSTRNVEMVRGLGADRVIDYTQENFTEGEQRYDLILDNVGNHDLMDIRRVMNPNAIHVGIGGPKGGDWLGPLASMLNAPLLSLFVSQQFLGILAELRQEDLESLAGMMREGKVTPVIDRRFPMRDAAQAITYLEEGHARGKIVLGW
jgi:NADPH:quinone reductase-like Zn-dependent oxidoreductase